MYDFDSMASDKEGKALQIAATELKAHLSKYLVLVETEDILITKNGRSTVTLTSSIKDRAKAMQSIFGAIKTDGPTSPDELRYERLTKKLGYEVRTF